MWRGGDLHDISTGTEPVLNTARRTVGGMRVDRRIRAGVHIGREAGRTMDDFHTVTLTNAVILRAGEKLTDADVIGRAGSWVVTALHFVYEVWRYTRDDSVVPDYMKNIWEEYTDHVAQMEIPEEKIHQMLHAGHCSWTPPGERRFATPEMIEGTAMVGEPEQVAEIVRTAEARGLHEVSILPGLEDARVVAKDFMERVVPLV